MLSTNTELRKSGDLSKSVRKIKEYSVNYMKELVEEAYIRTWSPIESIAS